MEILIFVISKENTQAIFILLKSELQNWI